MQRTSSPSILISVANEPRRYFGHSGVTDQIVPPFVNAGHYFFQYMIHLRHILFNIWGQVMAEDVRVEWVKWALGTANLLGVEPQNPGRV